MKRQHIQNNYEQEAKVMKEQLPWYVTLSEYLFKEPKTKKEEVTRNVIPVFVFMFLLIIGFIVTSFYPYTNYTNFEEFCMAKTTFGLSVTFISCLILLAVVILLVIPIQIASTRWKKKQSQFASQS